MARENLAGIDANLTDNNLTADQPIDLGKSILLIGTAGQGPVNEPLVARTVQDAVDIFGTRGNLIEAYMEAHYAPGGAKDIRLLRISNGSKAAVDIYELLSGTDEDAPSEDEIGQDIPALRLEALYPGSIYNNVSIRQEGTNIIAYNPVSEQETVIPYDPTGQTSGSVSDVKALANAINVDPNMGSVVLATANRIHTMFEIDVQEDWDYITVSNGNIQINLIEALTAFDVNDDGIIDYPECSGDENVDYTDMILSAGIDDNQTTVEIESEDGSIASIASDWPATGYIKVYKENLDGEEYEVEIMKYNGVGPSYGSGKATLSVDRGVVGTEAQEHDTDSIVSLYIPLFPLPITETAANRIEELVEVYELDNMEVELDSAGKATLELPYPIQMETNIARELLNLDGTEDIDGNGEAVHLVRNSFIGNGDGEQTNFVFTAYEEIDTDTLQVFRTSRAGTTVEITDDIDSVVSAGGDGNDYQAEIAFTNAPSDGSILTVSYDSVAFELTQLATLSAAEASNSYREYFVAGNQIHFGTAQPSDIKFVYPAKITYRIGDEAVVTGNEDHIITINPSSRDIDSENGTVIGLDYYYQPEWVDLTGALALQGGSDGINMSNSEKYRVLEDTYEAIADYPVDIIVLKDTYLDDTKIQYDTETGLPVEVNAGFALQLSEHLESMLEGVNEAFGVMSVKPADSARIADVNTWYDKLHNTSMSDRTRAANVMESLDARLLDVLAMELVVTNPNAASPYVTTGEAIFAGLSAKLDLASATTNKLLGNNVLGTRYKLSDRRLNALTGDRYVTARVRQGRGIVVTDGVTAAASGSDWTRRSTYNIVAGAMDAIRRVGEPYLGEGFGPQRKAALTTAINRVLSGLQEDGAIQSYGFSIEQTPAENTQGIARVPLVIQPAFELRKIRVTVKLSSTSV